MALASTPTLRIVATKTLPAREKAAFVARFTKWVADKHGGNQTHAGRDLGITQSHVSALVTGARGPGLSFLILLRRVSAVTLDEWLGLPPIQGTSAVLSEADVRRLSRAEYQALQDELADHEQEAKPRAPKKRAAR